VITLAECEAMKKEKVKEEREDNSIKGQEEN